MKFAYPQDPTHAVSAMRRFDEASDAATQQSDLERKQDIATVGETVPVIFATVAILVIIKAQTVGCGLALG